ncbi:membrane protein YqaA with SNARE-associated domain [Longimicrobium terrae]|uniref:Membrane protein YqaA with SNARE-associated domain n=2 Tax=Longimicrobium terrae TaxID=1639882 RepID=A0A841GXW3_9BACT|nr:VTT domain-containing protein [Longimicrobium terrae]MBB4636206.1 membrane protein YqaA with SNARE-associated domain [Longimicrobium terrae]MBB6070601.1 membrane protein YqaA with SNARE-associated domain [Longimicrobium terrae]
MSFLLACLATFGVAFASAVIPVIPIEIYLIGAAALAPKPFALSLALAAALGQMVGKILVYYAGTGAVKLPGKHLQNALTRANEYIATKPRSGGMVMFISAFVGFPPFVLMTLVAGAARMNLWLFLAIGLVGRFFRFAVCVLVPHLVRPWLHG